ncbi:hypothetical protein ACFFP0_00765 [Rhizobium puerariae]|uniref:Uncharacterized protein n=1 Tax=Rhizobium puerariae TaxID=1585791 RepID=A0ABV6ACE7_9HYPH
MRAMITSSRPFGEGGHRGFEAPAGRKAKGLSISRKAFDIRNLDGGRDKDRTCDPYDVNTVAAPETRASLTSEGVEVNAHSASNGPFLGHSLGKVEQAGRWLFLNREAVSGPLIPYLRCRFDLTNLEAIEASKLAHAFEYGGR